MKDGGDLNNICAIYYTAKWNVTVMTVIDADYYIKLTFMLF